MYGFGRAAFGSSGASGVSDSGLPSLRANTAASSAPILTRTTVSGLSSGAYMAGQFQIAYSRLVTGAGIVAGGPYGCAHTPGSELNPFWLVVLSWNAYRAQNQCMEDGWFFSNVPDPGAMAEYAERLAADGRIDPLEALHGDRLYIFSSRKDDTVERGVVEAAGRLLQERGGA